MELSKINVTYELPKVNYDLTDLVNGVNEIVENYNGLIIKEEDIADMKSDIAELNKLSKLIDSKRKEISKVLSAPIKEFEKALKDITSKIDTTYRDIKNQIDDYTNQQKELRRNKILSFDEWQDYMSFNETWLNKSTSDKSIKFDMSSQKYTYESNVKIITTMCNGLNLKSDKYIELLKTQNIDFITDLINNDSDIKKEYGVSEEPIKVVGASVNDFNFTIGLNVTLNQLELLKLYLDRSHIEYKLL